jgi:phage shock protein C
MDPQIKKLTKSNTNRQISGVCGGIAEFFGIDSTIIRILFVLSALFGGSGLLIYIAMALIVPEKAI